MEVCIGLRAEDIDTRASVIKADLYTQINRECYSLVHVVVLPQLGKKWKSLCDFVWCELQPYISKGHPPLIYCGDNWKCHIPYLVSPQSVKELDDILTEGDKYSYDQLSKWTPMMIREEEFNTLLQKLQEGIKNKLISSGYEIFHDFNES